MARPIPGSGRWHDPPIHVDPELVAALYDGYFRETVEYYLDGYGFIRMEPGVIVSTDTSTTPRVCRVTVNGVQLQGVVFGKIAPVVGGTYTVYTHSFGERWVRNVRLA